MFYPTYDPRGLKCDLEVRLSARGPSGVLAGQAHPQDDCAATSAAADRDLITNPAHQLQAPPAPAGSRCGGWPRRPLPAVADLGLHRGPPDDLQHQPGHRRPVPDRVRGDLVNREHEIARPLAAQARLHRPPGDRPAHLPQAVIAEPHRVRRGRSRRASLSR